MLIKKNEVTVYRGGAVANWLSVRRVYWNCLDLHCNVSVHWLLVSSQNISNSWFFHLQMEYWLQRTCRKKIEWGLGQDSVNTPYKVLFSWDKYTRLNIHHNLVQQKPVAGSSLWRYFLWSGMPASVALGRECQGVGDSPGHERLLPAWKPCGNVDKVMPRTELITSVFLEEAQPSLFHL